MPVACVAMRLHAFGVELCRACRECRSVTAQGYSLTADCASLVPRATTVYLCTSTSDLTCSRGVRWRETARNSTRRQAEMLQRTATTLEKGTEETDSSVRDRSYSCILRSVGSRGRTVLIEHTTETSRHTTDVGRYSVQD